MILGARENSLSLLYNEPKYIENRRVLFAGDDFEKYFYVWFLIFCWFFAGFAHYFLYKSQIKHK